jgi:CheY-like chemotaxis protein
VLHLLLAQSGHYATELQSPRSGVKQTRIEILLTDINMPGIAGYDLAEQAKRLRPGVKPVLVSGRETVGYGYPLLRKPLLQSDLAQVIRETTGWPLN